MGSPRVPPEFPILTFIEKWIQITYSNLRCEYITFVFAYATYCLWIHLRLLPMGVSDVMWRHIFGLTLVHLTVCRLSDAKPLLLHGPSETHFGEALIKIPNFSVKKTRLKMSSAKCLPFCWDLNLLSHMCDWCSSYPISGTGWSLWHRFIHRSGREAVLNINPLKHLHFFIYGQHICNHADMPISFMLWFRKKAWSREFYMRLQNG